MQSAPSLLSADQLGELIGCTGATVRKWHREGLIPAAVHEGYILRFEEAAVRKALRARAKAKESAEKTTPLDKLMVPTC